MSATSRNAGFALNAMPSPAVVSMSMSFAPSPTATDCASGTPYVSANRRSATALPGAVHDLADDAAGEHAVDDLQLVGGAEVQPQLVDQPGR